MEAEKDKEYIVILKCEVDNLQFVNEENKMIIQTIKEEKKVMKDKLDMTDLEHDNFNIDSKMNIYSKVGVNR